MVIPHELNGDSIYDFAQFMTQEEIDDYFQAEWQKLQDLKREIVLDDELEESEVL